MVVSGNAFDGLEIFETAGAAPMSTVSGLVAWGNIKQGIQLFGGEKVKVRGSVLLNNKLNGLLVTSSDASAAIERSDDDRSRQAGQSGAEPAAGLGRARTPI